MGRGLVFDTTCADGTLAVELMIKPMVSEIREINSNLGQTTHTMLIAVAAKAWIRSNTFIDFILKSLSRRRRIDFTIKSLPVIDAVWEKAVCIPFCSSYWGLRDVLM